MNGTYNNARVYCVILVLLISIVATASADFLNYNPSTHKCMYNSSIYLSDINGDWDVEDYSEPLLYEYGGEAYMIIQDKNSYLGSIHLTNESQFTACTYGDYCNYSPSWTTIARGIVSNAAHTVLANDTVYSYMGGETDGYSLMAFNAQTGAVRWQKIAGYSWDGGANVDDDGNVYVVGWIDSGYPHESYPHESIQAISYDVNGNLRWNTTVVPAGSDILKWEFEQIPQISPDNERMYFYLFWHNDTSAGQDTLIYAYDTSDGSEEWSKRIVANTTGQRMSCAVSGSDELYCPMVNFTNYTFVYNGEDGSVLHTIYMPAPVTNNFWYFDVDQPSFDEVRNLIYVSSTPTYYDYYVINLTSNTSTNLIPASWWNSNGGRPVSYRPYIKENGNIMIFTWSRMHEFFPNGTLRYTVNNTPDGNLFDTGTAPLYYNGAWYFYGDNEIGHIDDIDYPTCSRYNIENIGFETGSLSPWASENSVSVQSTIVYSGDHAAEMYFMDGVTEIGQLYQDFCYQDGVTQDVSFRIYPHDWDNMVGTVEIRHFWYNEGMGWGYYHPDDCVAENFGEEEGDMDNWELWNGYDISECDRATNYMRYYFELNHITGSHGYMYVDSGDATPTPTPTPHCPTCLTNMSYNSSYTYDIYNGTYTQYWLLNITTFGDFSIYGFAYSLMAPIIGVFGFWIFVIIWLTYLAMVWIRSGEITLPLVIGLLTAGVWSYLFPPQALRAITVILAICIAVIFVKTFRDQY